MASSRISHCMVLQQLFSSLDESDSGVVTYDQVYSGLVGIGAPLTQGQFDTIFNEIDASQEGHVDLPQFITLISKLGETEPQTPPEPTPINSSPRSSNGQPQRESSPSPQPPTTTHNNPLNPLNNNRRASSPSHSSSYSTAAHTSQQLLRQQAYQQNQALQEAYLGQQTPTTAHRPPTPPTTTTNSGNHSSSSGRNTTIRGGGGYSNHTRSTTPPPSTSTTSPPGSPAEFITKTNIHPLLGIALGIRISGITLLPKLLQLDEAQSGLVSVGSVCSVLEFLPFPVSPSYIYQLISPNIIEVVQHRISEDAEINLEGLVPYGTILGNLQILMFLIDAGFFGNKMKQEANAYNKISAEENGNNNGSRSSSATHRENTRDSTYTHNAQSSSSIRPPTDKHSRRSSIPRTTSRVSNNSSNIQHTNTTSNGNTRGGGNRCRSSPSPTTHNNTATTNNTTRTRSSSASPPPLHPSSSLSGESRQSTCTSNLNNSALSEHNSNHTFRARSPSPQPSSVMPPSPCTNNNRNSTANLETARKFLKQALQAQLRDVVDQPLLLLQAFVSADNSQTGYITAAAFRMALASAYREARVQKPPKWVLDRCVKLSNLPFEAGTLGTGTTWPELTEAVQAAKVATSMKLVNEHQECCDYKFFLSQLGVGFGGQPSPRHVSFAEPHQQNMKKTIRGHHRVVIAEGC